MPGPPELLEWPLSGGDIHSFLNRWHEWQRQWAQDYSFPMEVRNSTPASTISAPGSVNRSLWKWTEPRLVPPVSIPSSIPTSFPSSRRGWRA